MAVPVINAKLSLKDVVENINKTVTNVQEQPDGLYIFYFYDTLNSGYAENLIFLPNQSFSKSFGITLPEAVSLSSGNITKVYSDTAQFSTTNNQQLKYIDLKGGNLNFNFSSSFNQSIDLTLTIPSVEQNGTPLTRSYSLSPNSTVSDVINLSGYRISLEGSGNLVNSFIYTIQAKIISNGQPASGTETLTSSFGITNLKYKLMYGSMGSFAFPPYSGNVIIEIFQNAQQGQVTLNNPKFMLTMDNSFGVPGSFSVDTLKTKAHYGAEVPLQSTGNLKIPGPNTINAPTTPGTDATTYYELDNTNSNIVQALQPATSRIDYKITPTIGSQGSNEFIMDTSNVKIYAEAEIPMDGTIKIFAMSDTAYNIKLPNQSYIESATVKIKTTNSIPMDVWVQAYWLDSLGHKLDSVLTTSTNLIRAGTIDQNGKVVSANTQYEEITYDVNRYNHIKNAKMLMIEGHASSSNNGNTPVKFYSYNELDVKISVLVKAKVDFK